MLWIRRILCMFLILLFTLIVNPSHALIRNIQENMSLVYHPLNSSGEHVADQTITLKIQRRSDGYWFDFSDSTFKVSGWTNKYTTLTEEETEGFYYYSFNPPASETTSDQYLFLVDNTDEDYKDHQSILVSYEDIGTSTLTDAQVATAVWGAETRQLTDTQVFDLTGDITGNLSGSVGSVDSPVTVGTNNDKTDYALSTAGIAAIWNELQSGYVTPGTFGYFLDAQVSLAGGGDGLTAEEVWDYDISGYSDAGLAGTYLKNMAVVGDPWVAELPGSYTTGQAGYDIPALIKQTRGR